MDDYASIIVGKGHPGSRIAETPLKDPLPMVLHVPTAPHRPGDVPCFSPMSHQPGDLPRPDTLAPFEELRHMPWERSACWEMMASPRGRGSRSSVRNSFAAVWR